MGCGESKADAKDSTPVTTETGVANKASDKDKPPGVAKASDDEIIKASDLRQESVKKKTKTPISKTASSDEIVSVHASEDGHESSQKCARTVLTSFSDDYEEHDVVIAPVNGDVVKSFKANSGDYHANADDDVVTSESLGIDVKSDSIVFNQSSGNSTDDRRDEIVTVDVHSASDENLCYSDLSERSADNDYEDIYQVREEAANHQNSVKSNGNTAVSSPITNNKMSRRHSRDSGSHSRSTSVSSNSSHSVVQVHSASRHNLPADGARALEVQASLNMAASTESGVSSGSPSDPGGSEEETENKAKVSLTQRRSLPHALPDARTLKRVSSESSFLCPPPPPPPPPTQEVAHQLPHTRATMPLPPTPKQENEYAHVVEGGGSCQEEEAVVHEENKAVYGGHTNRQKVLPFVLPKFASTSTDSDVLIKPSEYLRSIGGVKPHPPHSDLQAQHFVKPMVPQTSPETAFANTSNNDVSAATSSAPPPPPLPDAATLDSCQHPASPGETLKNNENSNGNNTSNNNKQMQPLGAISIHDLNSVQLRRTDKMLASKTLSAPPSSAGYHVPKTTKPDQPFMAQKTDLIAELKMSKDITGIKKMKVERAKVEERQEKELFTEITKQLTVDSFVEKIPDKDVTGNPIPPWKRQMLAKKAADKARKELEEQKKLEAEEKRLQSIPAWKRQLIAKKEEQLIAKKEELETRKPQVYTPRVVEEKRVVLPSTNGTTVITINGDNNNNNSNHNNNNNNIINNNKENATPHHVDAQDMPNGVVVHTPPTSTAASSDHEDEEPTHVMPWRSQLRKTNSKLNLLE